jgi:hypothetical protein
MSDPMDDPTLLWGELYASVLRAAPRLDYRFPPYPCCDLPPSWAGNIGGLCWCACLSCNVRWQTSENIIDPAPDEALHAFMVLLGDCIDLTPLPDPPAFSVTATILREETSTMKQTPTASFNINPRVFQGPRDNKLFSGLSDAQCIAVTDHLLRDLREFPLTERHPMTGRLFAKADHMWQRIRNLPIDDRGNTVGRVLQRPEIPSPVFALRDCIVLFLDLREKRALLARQLHDLDAIAEVFASSEAAPAVVGG